ncbi:hypothetical protein PJJ26_04185 [Tenacibaculum finnmarkense]|nr:hypothetical protein PJJ26_04185 [Tenacibaculum finnmarkense]
MKNIPLLLLIMLLSLFNMQSQVKVCETPKDDAIDLNVISVKKCDIKEKKLDKYQKQTSQEKELIIDLEKKKII